MNYYKFFYGDGQLAVTKATALHHLNLYQRLVDWKLLPKGVFPSTYVGGTYYTDGTIERTWDSGNTPNDDALRFMIKQKIDDYNPELYPYYGANVEDTEPEFNFGFLTDPHDALYPCAWEDDKMRPECTKALKAHVLNSIEGAGQMAHADQWIYFTVYGSGASYNWDEDGDFDVQMWVDIAKYNEHHPDSPKEADDLITDVRRQVQLVNFPSFADLGLDTSDCAGEMLIQFYPKIGTGSADENEAQKPYACYDMETDEWIVRPKPITPEFYGEHFVMLLDKCKDIADQAQGLIDQFQRNVLTWQFFNRLYSQTDNKLFLNTAQKAQIDATKEQQGIATLFEGIFGGRQKAYSPEGQGIEDEGDETQKLLEVWGVFQQLKHWSRAPLPWDPQDMPADPTDELSKKTAGWWEDPKYLVKGKYPYAGTFGYLNGHLILGITHHKGIMASLISAGWTWDELMNADQAWGWYAAHDWDDPEKAYVNVKFVSDSGYQNDKAVDGALDAFARDFQMPIQKQDFIKGVETQDYGTGLGATLPNPNNYSNDMIFSELPQNTKTSVVYDPNYYKTQGLPSSGCFGYIAGHLLLGGSHHKAILGSLIDNGWTWEQLFEAPQAWGWYYLTFGTSEISGDPMRFVTIQFTSDSGLQNEEEMSRARQAFAQLFHMPIKVSPYTTMVKGFDQYGTGLGSSDKPSKGYIEEDLIGDVPPPPKTSSLRKVGVPWEKKYFIEQGLPTSGCFGYVNNHLILGMKHHQLIMMKLIDKGWTWEQLMNVPQAWGWFEVGAYGKKIDNEYWPMLNLSFSSDAGIIDAEEMKRAAGAFAQRYHMPANVEGGYHAINPENKEEDYGKGLHGKGWQKHYQEGGTYHHLLNDIEDVPPPPDQDYTYTPINYHHLHQLSLIPATPVEDSSVVPKTEPSNIEPISVGDSYSWGENSFTIKRISMDGLATMAWKNGGVTHAYVSDIQDAVKNGTYKKIDISADNPWKIGDKFKFTPNADTHTVTNVTPDYVTFVGKSFVGISGEWTYHKKDLEDAIKIDPEKASTSIPGGGTPPPKNIDTSNLNGLYSIKDSPHQLLVTNSDDPDKLKAVWLYPEEGSDPVNAGISSAELNKWLINGEVTKIESNQAQGKYAAFYKSADWNAIMQKAQKIRQNNGVDITLNEPDHVVGTVQSGSDPENKGPYTTEIWRDDPSSQAITMWDCDCPWSDYSWGRTRQWKKYEGRPCAHTLALFWQAQSKPPQTQNLPEQTPPTPAPGGQMIYNQGLIQPIGQPPTPNVPLIQQPEQPPAPIPVQVVNQPQPQQQGPPAPPPFSKPTTPNEIPPRSIGFPGALSHWKESASAPDQNTWKEAKQQIHYQEAFLYNPHVGLLTDSHGVHWTLFEKLEGHLDPDEEGQTVAGWVFLEGDPPDDFPIAVFGSVMNPEYAQDSNQAESKQQALQELSKEWPGIKEVPYDNRYRLTQLDQASASWKEAAFQNGDIVRAWQKTKGFVQPAYGQPGYEVTIGKNTSGEVIYSDDESTIAIFPLNTGPLQHHLVKVECPTETLYLDNTSAQPFVKKHTSWDDYDEGHESYEAEAPEYKQAFIYVGNPYNELLSHAGSSEHSDLIQAFIEGHNKDLNPDSGDDQDEMWEQLVRLPIAAGHIGYIPSTGQLIYAFYSDFFGGVTDYLLLTKEAAAALKKRWPSIRPATEEENSHEWAGDGEYFSGVTASVAIGPTAVSN